jgi:hypothetical protein
MYDARKKTVVSQSSVRMIFLITAKLRPKRVVNNTVNKEKRFNTILLFTEIVLYYHLCGIFTLLHSTHLEMYVVPGGRFSN